MVSEIFRPPTPETEERKFFNPGDIVQWTQEAVDNVNPRDMLDSALVVRGRQYEVVDKDTISPDSVMIKEVNADINTAFPARAASLELA